jgi:hypothetical protein
MAIPILGDRDTMILRTETIGHFENPDESLIRDSISYSGEGAQEGDLVKLMTDETSYISIWIGRRTIGHSLTLRSGSWKLDCSERLSTEDVIELFCDYMRGNTTSLAKLSWTRPIDRKLIDNLLNLGQAHG